MKKILLLGFLISFQSVFSQVSMGKNRLIKDGTKYKLSQYEQVFQNAEARDYFKKVRSNKTAAEICAYTGGFSLGFGLATLISGKENTIYANGTAYKKEAKKGGLGFLAAGVGLISIGIPFALAADKNIKKAIQLENGEAIAFQPYFKVESAGNGLAFSYNF